MPYNNKNVKNLYALQFSFTQTEKLKVTNFFGVLFEIKNTFG